MDLTNKTVLITGATGGIGSVLASHLTEKEARLILLGRNADKLAALTKELGGHVLTSYSCDLTDTEARDETFTRIASENSKIDVVIHAAGIGIYKDFESITQEDYDSSLKTNLEAPYFLTQRLIPALGEGSLVLTIGSGAGVIPMRGRSLYCMSKFALRGAILSLTEEYKGTHPAFCLITLGSTLTSFGPHSLDFKQQESLDGKAYFTPEWVAKKLIQVIEDENRESEIVLYPGEYGFGTWQKP